MKKISNPLSPIQGKKPLLQGRLHEQAPEYARTTSSPGPQYLTSTFGGTNASVLERRVLAPKVSSLEKRRDPLLHEIQSPVSNLKRLFENHLSNDSTRCFQGWKVVTDNEWRNGLSVHDIGPMLKEWLKLCIIGVVQHSEKIAFVPVDEVDQTIQGTSNILKNTLQKTSDNGDLEKNLKNHLLKETVLFRNMDGEQFHSSLKAMKATTPQKPSTPQKSSTPQRSSTPSQEQGLAFESSNHGFGDSADDSASERDSFEWRNDQEVFEDDLQERESLQSDLIDFSRFTENLSIVQTKANPFYQIIKEFIEIACVPLQMVKSSDKLLKERKYAELLEILGFICVNCVQWDTICLRLLRAIISIFHSSAADAEGNASHSLLVQNRYIRNSSFLTYINLAFAIYRENTLASIQNKTSSIENCLPPKVVDILMEFLFLYTDISNLPGGASALCHGSFIKSLLQYIETTRLVREENVPTYIHTAVDIIYNIVEKISKSRPHEVEDNEHVEDMKPKTSLTPLQIPPSLPKAVDRRPVRNPGLSIHPGLEFDPAQTTALLSYLQSLLEQLQATATKVADYNLKNDILMIMLTLSYYAEYKPCFLASGTILFICRYFQREVSAEPTATMLASSSPSKYSPPNYESEYVLLMWNIMTSLAFDEECFSLILEEGFVAILLNYVDITCKYLPNIAKWTEDQLKEIRQQALKSLFFLSTMHPASFSDNAGCETLVELLTSYFQPDDQGFCEADDEENSQIIDRITSILVNISSTQVGCDELHDKNCFHQIFELAMKSQAPEGEHMFVQRRCNFLEIITRMCLNCSQQLVEIQQVSGVQRLHNSVKELFAQGDSFSKQDYSVYIHQLLNTLWNCATYDEENITQFVLEDGVRTLLDIVDDSDDFVRYCCLGFLADILESNDAIYSLNHWISRHTKKSAVSTLVRLWREEDFELVNAKKRDAELSVYFGCKRSDFDFRVRIYLVLSLLNFRDQSVAADSSNLEDEAILCEIAKYGDSLDNLAWVRVADDLEREGVRPTSPDADILQERIDSFTEIGESVQLSKASIRKTQDRLEKEKEEVFFGYIKNLVQSKMEEQKLFRKTVSLVEQKRMKDRLRREQSQ